MRNLFVTVLIVFAVTLLIWAGVHNNRERHQQIQQEQQSQAVLVPEGKTSSAQTTADVVDGVNFRGKPAPGFTLPTIDGKQVSLSDYKGKVVLVNFWATWCAPCKLEMPWLADFQHKYASQGLVVLGVTADDAPKDEIRKVIAKTGADYQILLKDDKVEKAYGDVSYLPSSFYVGRDGKIVEQTAGIAGAASKDEIEATIKKALEMGGSD